MPHLRELKPGFNVSATNPLMAFAWCECCGELCPKPRSDDLVAFCDECLEASDLQAYPDGWVVLGGGD